MHVPFIHNEKLEVMPSSERSVAKKKSLTFLFDFSVCVNLITVAVYIFTILMNASFKTGGQMTQYLRSAPQKERKISNFSL